MIVESVVVGVIDGARETCNRLETLTKQSQSMTIEEDPTCSTLKLASSRGAI